MQTTESPSSRLHRYLGSILDALREGFSNGSHALPASTLGVGAFSLACLGLFWYLAPDTRNVMFREGRALDWLSSAFLISAAIGYAIAFVRSRRRVESGSRIWLIVAAGFAFLAFDERFQLHERFGRGDAGGPLGLRNLGDGLLMSYGILASVAGVIFFRTLARCPSLRFLSLAFVFYLGHTAADTLMDSTGFKLRLEESFKLLAGMSFGMAGLVAAFRYREPPTRSGDPGLGRFQNACLVVLGIALAGWIWTGGTDLNASAPTPWRSPAAWISSAYLWAAGLLCWTMGRSLAYYLLAFGLSGSAIFVGVSGCRSIEKHARSETVLAFWNTLSFGFGVPLFWATLLVVVAAMATIWRGLGSNGPVRLFLGLGVAFLAMETGLGLLVDPTYAEPFRMLGCGFILIAMLNRFFETEPIWNDQH